MNFSKMLQAQKDFDDRIMQDKNLTDDEVIKKLLVAIQVELAEMANEARFFKYWSEDQEPNTELYTFVGDYDWEYQAYDDPRENEEIAVLFGYNRNHPVRVENPLLEEYVDALHFFMSIAIRKDWIRALDVSVGALNVQPGDLDRVYLDTVYFLNASHQERNDAATLYNGMTKAEMHFHYAFINFLIMGLVHFRFNMDQIEAAYYEKNEKNHARQDAGY